MFRKIGTLILGIVSVTIGPFAMSVLGQLPDSGQFSELTLEISATKPSFVPLEPIPITLKLSNRTNNIIGGHGSLHFSEGYVDIFVQTSSGQIRKFEQLAFERVSSIGGLQNIKPQARAEVTQVLSMGLDRYLPSPGNYKLRAVLKNRRPGEETRSNWIDIRITEPTDLNLGAYEFLREKPSDAMFLHTISREGSKDALEDFVRRFPNTSYTDYALYLLAEYYFYQNDHGRAKEFLNQLDNKPDFVFADKVDQYLKKLSEK
jgi:hypothetical protein